MSTQVMNQSLPDLLGDEPAAGGNPPAAGAAGTNPPASGTGATSAGAPTFNFREAIPAEYKEAGWLQNVNDIPTLLKNYANAQKMIGADKIPLPGPNASPEEIRGVLSKIGLPDKLEEYKVAVPKELEGTIDPKFVEGIAKFGHEAGLLPSQAAKLVEHLSSSAKEIEAAEFAEKKASVDAGLAALKTEWGAAYQENIARARAAVKVFGGDDAMAHLRASGAGADPVVLKLLAKAGESLKEAQIKGEGGAGDPSLLSPQQARQKIDEIKGDLKSAYYDSKHPSHEAAKTEVRKLYAMAFPEEKK